MRERGQAVLFTILLVASVGITLVVYGASREVARTAQADTRTRVALEQAREALIARAVADVNRPGSLPCPDADGDGSADLLAGIDCPSYIGRLPWRTLGVGDLRDESGERLWYALSPNFRDYTTVQINSNTKGNRTVYAGSTSTSITTQAAAVIFAPGTLLPGQIRDAAVVSCTMSGIAVNRRRDQCAANYLESAGGGTPAWNNASANGPFMTGATSLSFNDKALVLRTTDFMPLVERRVARDLREVLRDYRDNSRAAYGLPGGCDCFPWADSDNDGTSNTGANRGRIPLVATPHAWGTAWVNAVTKLPLINPLTGAAFDPLPTLPAYFAANNWQSVIYYSVGRGSLQNAGGSCTTCSANATLAVDGSIGYAMVLITPGPTAPAQTRTAWAHFLDDAENRDANPQAAGGGAAADPAANDAYRTPPQACPSGQCPTQVGGAQRCVASTAACPRNVTSPTLDRLYAIMAPVTGPPSNPVCTSNANSLLNATTCHTKGNNVKPQCAEAAKNLQGCSCATSANALITPPCRNSLNPPQCQAAVSAVKSCTS